MVAERMRVHRHLGMGVRTKVPRTLRADGPVAQRGIFGRARDDADVFGRGQPFSPCRTERSRRSLIREISPNMEWSEWPVIGGAMSRSVPRDQVRLYDPGSAVQADNSGRVP